MVILPFYQILIASIDDLKTDYTLFMTDGRIVGMNCDLNYPAYNPNSKNICGIREKENKNIISLCELHLSKMNASDLFSLSDKRILYPAISPDNQKIAFIVEDKNTQEVFLRVIVREEFGWFPMPFVKLPASLRPVCFCTPDTLMYTNDKGALIAVLLSKHPKTVQMQEIGQRPVYHQQAGLTAFIRNDTIVVCGNMSAEIKTNGVTALSFSKDGRNLLYAEADQLYRYHLPEKEKQLVLENPTGHPVTLIAEI